MLKPAGRIAVIAVAAAIGYLLLWPIPVEPVAWTPAAHHGLEGVYADEVGFRALGLRLDEVGPGPEDVAPGPDGRFYTGLQDGRIVRFLPGGPVQDFVDTGGRPLGMQFDAAGNLIVADAFRGLLSVSPAGAVRVLTDSVDGVRLQFVDDLDIAADGTIWFSNASQRSNQHQWLLDFWEGHDTGQLLSHDPATGRTQVRMDRLRFANGVALGPGDAYVLVNETMTRRIWRLWLEGPRAGARELFADALPGHPDNLSHDGGGLFWVALPSKRSGAFDWLAPRPALRRMLLRLPASWIDLRPAPLGWVVALGEDGQARFSLRDERGPYTDVTSVNEYQGRLYLGSIRMTSVASLESPGSGESS